MTSTNYRVIGFGVAKYSNGGEGFFNQFAFSSTLGYAQGIFNEHLADPEMDGAVLIKVEHETWQVIEEFGTENTSIVYGPLGTFRVDRAPKLVLIN